MKPISVDGLSDLAMWTEWQRLVESTRPDFAASPIYVDQRSQTQEEFETVAERVAGRELIDPEGKTRDKEFGGMVRDTQALGPVTRMWLDSNVEGDFLRRQLPNLAGLRVLDVGAGYGRLAVSLRPLVASYACVDAVPVSTEISRAYCARFAPDVEVVGLDRFAEWAPAARIDLAINVHSWSECSGAQIARWIGILADLGVSNLFTVSHGRHGGIERPYRAWDGLPFLPTIERSYELVAEESIGLSRHPHALWRLRASSPGPSRGSPSRRAPRAGS